MRTSALLLTLLFPLFLGTCHRPPNPLSEEFADPLAEYKYSCQRFDSLQVLAALPLLEAEYGDYVDCPTEYRDKLLAALSFYPKLKGVKIRVIQKKLKTSMAARPDNFATVRRNRRYKIYLDDVTDKVTDFRRYPYSAQIGCFIHELGHVAYYERRSNVRLAYDGANYVSSQKFRSRYETYADHNAIARGGGYYCYLFRDYTLNKAGISESYREFKRDNYYTGKELYRLHLEAVEGAGLEVECE